MKTLYYKKSWKALATTTYKLCDLIFLFDADMDFFLLCKKKFADKEIILVEPGNKFAKTSRGYTVNPTSYKDYQQMFDRVDVNGKSVGIVYLWPRIEIEYFRDAFSSNFSAIDEYLAVSFYSIFRLTKALFLDYGKSVHLLYFYENNQAEHLLFHRPIASLAKTIFHENSKFYYKTVGVDDLQQNDYLSSIIEENLRGKTCEEIKYDGENRQVGTFEKLQANISKLPFKQGGVYLITGGSGGLGKIISQYLNENYGAKLILIGRSSIEHNQLIQMQKKMNFIYIEADVSDYEQLCDAIKIGKEKFINIDGVIHSAGVACDSFIRSKDLESISTVFKPKIHGTMYLDKATKNEKLDFFVNFSSFSAVVGNAGQCDYSYANSFMDNFSEMRNVLVESGQRSGNTVSINWPLWLDGKMQVSCEVLEFLNNTYGMYSLPTSNAIQALEFCLSTNISSLIVAYGEEKKIDKLLGLNVSSSSLKNSDDTKKAESIDLISQLEEDIRNFCAEILRINSDKIRLDTNISDYGFDSFSLTGLVNKINRAYGLELMPAVFFEHLSIGSLVNFLNQEHYQILYSHYKNNKADYLDAKEQEIPQVNYTNKIKENKSLNAVLTENEKNQDIAIVGVSSVMPGSQNLQELWNNLYQGKDLITKVPNDRTYWHDKYIENTSSNSSEDWGGFIEDVDKFDASFFGISPREAVLMDPQQRIALEQVWKSIEDAGYKPSELSGKKIGLFLGVSGFDYNDLLSENNLGSQTHTPSGIAHSILPNRISYLLDFRGPSEPVDTACSSSLVAIHRAVRAINNGDCTSAIAGGVNVILSKRFSVCLKKSKMLSPDGRCKTFDKSANGYVRGEGAGVVFLKPVDQAVTDGNYIYGVIKGSAVNHGGRVNSLTTPNPNAQAEVILKAHEQANIPPSTISYIEAHGTGTSLGDPIEINGLKIALEKLHRKHNSDFALQHCALGSIKSNIGHLESAAGVAGLIKVLLAIKYKTIPQTIHIKKINPQIQLDSTPFYIANKKVSWPQLKNSSGNDVPCRAGVSSFGFGGVNAHLVIEEFQCIKKNSTLAADYIFVFSAKTEQSLGQIIANFALFLQNISSSSLYTPANIAATLQQGREEMHYRLAVVAKDNDDLVFKLEQYKKYEQQKDVYTGNVAYDQDNSISVDKDFAPHRIANMWVNGVIVDWQKISPSYQRVPLPSYPFSRKKHWIEKVAPEKPRSSELSFSHNSVYIQNSWSESSYKKLSHINQSKVLVFGNDISIMNYFPEGVFVKAGDRFSKQGSNIFEINSGEPKDYIKLIEELSSCGKLPEVVVHFWSRKSFSDDSKSMIRLLEHSFYSFSYTLQALAQIECKIIYLHQPSDNELQPFYSGISALIKSAMLENSKITCKAVALESWFSQKEIAQIIFYEVLEKSKDFDIRYSSGKRFVKKLELFQPQAVSTTSLRYNGVYIITGGTGGIGKIFATYLAKTYQAKLILTGRSPLLSTTQNIIKNLEEFGAQVFYLQSDMSKQEDVNKLVAETQKLFGSIHGIIHCAGVNNREYLSDISKSQSETILLPKINGSVYLDLATAKENLDFFVMFSSIAAITESLGMPSYAYANCFMDEFAQLRSSWCLQGNRYGKTVSINWPLWRNGGMVTPKKIEDLLFKTVGMKAIEDNTGIEIFTKALTFKQTNFLYVQGNKEKIQKTLGITSAESKTELVSTKGDPVNSSILYSEIRSYLTEMISKILQIGKYEINDESTLHEYGFDSIMLAEFAAEINDKYDLSQSSEKLTPATFFEYTTLNSLSKYLSQNIRNEEPVIVPEKLPEKSPEVITVKREEEPEMRKNTDIAIIGMDGVFPKSPTLDVFWKNLINNKNFISEIPKNRWNWEEHIRDNSDAIKWGGFVDNVDKFAARFFQISRREAELMDPQHRLFIEVIWQCIENAGINPDSLKNKNIGIFAGITLNDYVEVIKESKCELDGYIATGTAHSMLANRISYMFDFRGPSQVIDTACSSSLVAVCQAVESIRNNQCSMAIAGGVNLMFSPFGHTLTSKAGMLSEDGKCKTFDQEANGYVRGEGVGAILLKRFSEAQADNDNIYAVIKGVAVNHGGKANSLTAPRPDSQAELIIAAQKEANVDPSTITYIEAHGTGTPLGDPVEINGLKKAFRTLNPTKDPSNKPHCAVATLKSSAGHLEAAAGIAGVIKTVLSMQRGTIPGNIHFQKQNAHINLEGTPFYIIKDNKQWLRLKNPLGEVIPRIAGVSSFGFGGTNAHIVLEEYTSQYTQSFNSSVVIVLSTKNEDRMKVYAKNILDFLELRDSLENRCSITDFAYTLQVGRQEMQYRLAFVVSSFQELQEKLIRYVKGDYTDEFFINQCTNKISSLIEGEAGKEFIRILLQNEQYFKLAELWTLGITVDWKLLYKNRPCKVPLPTYPFEKESFWASSSQRKLPQNDVQKAKQQLSRNETAKQLNVEKETGQPNTHKTIAQLDTQEPQIIQRDLPDRNKVSDSELRVLAVSYLTKIIADVLKLDCDKFEPEEDFEVYGIDSIMIGILNNRLSEKFGKLSSILFFKYKNIVSLANYFVENHRDTLMDNYLQENNNINDVLVEDPVQKDTNISSDISEQFLSEPTLDIAKKESKTQDIAIIGVSGKYPMAPNIQSFWENLKAGKDCVTDVPKERWNCSHYPMMYCNKGGFISDIDHFDPLFFNISPISAKFMDPQERLFLQVVWECLENAGYTRKRLEDPLAGDKRGKVSVFAGVSFNDYHLYAMHEWEKGNIIPVDSQICSVANRVSYLLNLRGPSLSIDTACSSSLYAIHLGCESIQSGQADMAIAGGVSLSVHPGKFVNLCQINMLSKKGKCIAFGEGGDGIASGEGVGAVLLKPLEKAVSDGDQIYAVIKGSFINHDGKTKGYTVPNPVAQTELVEGALNNAKIDPRTISYVEAHGTGTALGDPIEVQALTDAYRSKTKDKQFCAVGSVKASIGHSEAAAGIAQLTKAILQLKHKTKVPTLIHSERLNPNIDFESSPFYVQTKLEKWERPILIENGCEVTYPRRAGISSFGATGVNVHLVLEESPDYKRETLPSIFPIVSQSIKSIPASTDEIQRYRKVYKKLEKLSIGLLLRALQKMGVFQYSGQEISLDKVKNEISLIREHYQLFDSILKVLVKNKFVRVVENTIRTTSKVENKEWSTENISERSNDIRNTYPEFNSHVNLIEKCIENYSEILQGKVPATEVIFPNASMKLVEGVYNYRDPFHQLTVEAVSSYLEERVKLFTEDQKIRIIEVGAGTGGTFVNLLPVLKKYSSHIDYTYTDISEGFLLHGENSYACEADFVKFKLLNIENDVKDQGYQPESFDLVIAVNVIHATKNISQALTNVKNLIKPNGVFVLKESTGFMTFSTLIFGLLKGWWLFEDKENRVEGSPLVSLEKWQELLLKNGFGHSQVVGTEQPPEHLIVAEKSISNTVQMIPLSTRTKENLIEYADKLKEFIAKNEVCLENLAYSLQVGREQYPFRVAFVVSSVKELEECLSSFCRGEKAKNLFVSDSITQTKKRDKLKIEQNLKRDVLLDIARKWVENNDFDVFYTELKRTISCPTYPFLKEVYWPYSSFIPHDKRNEEKIPQQKITNDLIENKQCSELSDVIEQVRIISGKILGFSETKLPSDDQGFFDMGMESIQSIKMITELNELFQVELYPTVIFDYPTIGELANYIVQMLEEKGEELEVLKQTSKEEKPKEEKPKEEKPKEEKLEEKKPEVMYCRRDWENLEDEEHDKIFSESILLVETPNTESMENAFEGCTTIIVQPSTSYEMKSSNRYGVNLQCENELKRMITEIENFPKTVVFTFSEKSLSLNNITNALENSIYLIFQFLKALAECKPKEEIRLCCLYLNHSNSLNPIFASLGGFLQTAIQEFPHITYSKIDIKPPFKKYISQINSPTFVNSPNSHIRYSSVLQRQSLVEMFKAKGSSEQKTFKDQGVYIITGGLGGLGLIFTEHITKKVQSAKIILIGRSHLDDVKLQKIKNYEAVDYIRADLSNYKEVITTIEKIKSKYGRIDGVIHSAGVIRDNYIVKKSTMEMKEVFAPKIYGVINLDKALKNEYLDFFALFSSFAAIGGNPGQSDYAFANSFLDNFATRRNQQVDKGMRQGKTCSINWTFWKQGGMKMDEVVLQQLYAKTGLVPIDQEEGIKAFEDALYYSGDHLAILKGNCEKIRNIVGIKNEECVVGVSSTVEKNDDKVAIIGMACRFPGGCDSPEKFWNFLLNEENSAADVPESRWSLANLYDQDPKKSGKIYTKKANFLQEGVDKFDAKFFGISPLEAKEMDPQQRLLLEVSYHALESAAQTGRELKGSRTGCFVGITGTEYSLLEREKQIVNPYVATGTIANIASGRIAYTLGLHGPALSVDTACSSSLVGIHLACESIRSGEVDMAIAGGVSAMLSPKAFIALCNFGALAKDGLCKTFDSKADGYGRGEGCGVIVLKKLSKAVEDKDRILAVVEGSAVNHDGHSGGLTVPSGLAQERLLREAIKNAGIKPNDIDYIEAHGTGTPLGDPIETRAIEQVFSKSHVASNPLFIGAVKANIGHLEAAAGIAGLMKTILCLQNQKIPAQLHMQEMNPKISIEKIPAKIPRKCTEKEIRVAGISSFGFSGTNAHVIISKPENIDVKQEVPKSHYILALSAKTPRALTSLVRGYIEFLSQNPNIGDMCFTTNISRSLHHYRTVFIFKDLNNLKEELSTFLENYDTSGSAVQFASHNCLYGNNLKINSNENSKLYYTSASFEDLKTIAAEYCQGNNIDWQAFYESTDYKKIALPYYPFERKRFWINVVEDKIESNEVLQGRIISNENKKVTIEYYFSEENFPEIADNLGVLHVGYYQEMLAIALKKAYSVTKYCVKNIDFLVALYLPKNSARNVFLLLELRENIISFEFRSKEQESNFDTTNARGTVEIGGKNIWRKVDNSVFSIKESCQEITGIDFYKQMDIERNTKLGASVKWIDHVWHKDNEAIVRLKKPEDIDNKNYTLGFHPGIWDACSQSFFTAFSKDISTSDKFIMVKWQDFIVSLQKNDKPVWCHVKLEKSSCNKTVIGQYSVFTENFDIIAQTSYCKLRSLQRNAEKVLTSISKKQDALAEKIIRPKSQKDLENALAKELAFILEMDTSELDVNESLRDLGIDSIVGIQFKDTIETKYQISIGIEDIIEGKSIRELVRKLSLYSNRDQQDDLWFYKYKANSKAKVRLFCIPYGGGGASIYKNWGYKLPNWIDVCPIQLPARENRISEQPIEDINALTDILKDIILSNADIPYVFYGHSMGALVAFALAKKIESEASALKPSHIFVGGYSAPYLENPHLKNIKNFFGSIGFSDIPDAKTIQEIPLDDKRWEVILNFKEMKMLSNGNIEFARKVTPLLIGDTKIVASYNHKEPCSIPITAFHGREDDRVTEEEIKAWKNVTEKPFDYHVVPGNHFFLHQRQTQKKMLKIITNIMKAL